LHIEKRFEMLLEEIDTQEIGIIEKLEHIITFIRPKNRDEAASSLDSIEKVIEFFEEKNQLSLEISDELNDLFIDSRVSANITNFDILSANGFGHEVRERFYNKFLPTPPKKGDIEYIFTTLFRKKDDYIWVNAIDDTKWLEFFSALFVNSPKIAEMKNHLFNELLYATEILSVWIASEEFDRNFIRLDRTLLSKNSAFIALQRNISSYVNTIQAETISIEQISIDFKHLQVLLVQCHEQVKLLKKKSLHKGISIDLTYQLERLGQIIRRLEDILDIVKHFDTEESSLQFMKLFKKAIVKNATKNSLLEIYGQGIRIVARSVTNNSSEHGEHYITNSIAEYFKMFFKAAGAGVIIALMALIKINIVQAGLSLSLQTTLISLNYGLGFVFIHLLGFVVATKQPAMTATTFAQEIEQEENKRANKKKLVELIFQVSRSQFAAVAGNVILALVVSFAIAYFIINSHQVILSDKESLYYLKGLEPLSALFFAATAGVWLFLSGLIAGYFDNRADLLELQERYYYQPILKKLIPDKQRQRVATYLYEHHGAIAGNFFFGILLGITPFVGHLLGLPLDIAHVAFSSAYLGFASMHVDISLYEFFYYLACVLLIGAFNLIVSFFLALKVSLLSRDTYFGNFFSFLKALLLEMLKHPHQLVFPFGYSKEKKKS
jgi:site-specific recombinase